MVVAAARKHASLHIFVVAQQHKTLCCAAYLFTATRVVRDTTLARQRGRTHSLITACINHSLDP